MPNVMEKLGAREISKRAVSRQLAEAARLLFSRDGFEATSIDGIADVAGVSPRTFYRYFASKEDVVMSWLDEPGPSLRERFSSRPGDEPIHQSLRRALDTFAEFTELQRSRFTLVHDLAQESESVKSAILQRWQLWEEEFAHHIAERFKVDMDTDPRPRMYAAFTMAGLRTAYAAAYRGEGDVAKQLDLYFELARGAESV